MGEPLKRELGNYTYREYLKWPEQERWEIINGTAYMSAAPSRKHQEVQVELIRQISNFLVDKLCRVYGSPFDVRLAKRDDTDEDIKNIVQPDITIVCDPSKLDDKGCKGNPDLVIEIVSPSTVSIDYIEKLSLYEKYGVKEYWIIHPIDEIVMIYKLADNMKYGRPNIYSKDNSVVVGIFEGLIIELKKVFGDGYSDLV